MTGGGASVSPLNIVAWRDFPLLDRLRAHTGLATTTDNAHHPVADGKTRRARTVLNHLTGELQPRNV